MKICLYYKVLLQLNPKGYKVEDGFYMLKLYLHLAVCTIYRQQHFYLVLCINIWNYFNMDFIYTYR